MNPLFEIVNKLVEGKNVALVGGAKSLINMNVGKEIDLADIVVRVNGNWPKLNHMRNGPDQQKSLGKRCDLLWLSRGQMVPNLITPIIRNTRPKLLMPFKVPPGAKSMKGDELDSKVISNMAKNWNIQVQFCNKIHENIQRLEKATCINAGLVVAYMLLQCKIKSLWMYGFDFFNSNECIGPYHNQITNRNFADKYILNDPRTVWRQPSGR